MEDVSAKLSENISINIMAFRSKKYGTNVMNIAKISNEHKRLDL